MVRAVDRGRFTCRVGDRVVTAVQARELGRHRVVVGDRVALVGDTTGDGGSLARIVRVEDRTSELRRSADDDTETAERVVVANADRLVIVCATEDPTPRVGFVDRCLVAAYAGHLEPVLCLTKADLGDPAPFLAPYADLGVVTLSWSRGRPVDDVVEALTGRTSVLFGHSGVGKSTLVNALVPDADRATGRVATTTGKGRHTSSSAVALDLPGGGTVVDTPGVRSLGLAHVDTADVVAAFPDLAEGAEECPAGCTHLTPECRLDRYAEEHGVPAVRLASLRRLLASRAGEEPAV